MSSQVAVGWMLTTVAVAGGVYVAVQQMKPAAPEPAEVVVEKLPEPPIIDVVRIENGLATIAGTGTPGEEIMIMTANNEIAKTTIQDDGNFAIIFDYVVPDGGAILEVNKTSADGQITPAEKSIAVIPKFNPEEGEEAGVATIKGDFIDIEVDNREKLNFAGVVYEDRKEGAGISGTSTPRSEIRIMLDDLNLDTVTTDENGKWTYQIPSFTLGSHKLKLVSNDEQELEIEIIRDQIVETTRIVRGDSLWRIAEKTYGDGNRYIDIYNVNADKIKNPDMIFPDQEFEIIVKN